VDTSHHRRSQPTLKPRSSLRSAKGCFRRRVTKVTELGKEIRDFEAHLTVNTQDVNIRLVKVETRLQMIYNIAVARASDRQGLGSRRRRR
jgi:hypothetical protein